MQRFSGAEANAKYPGLKLPRDFDCVLESEGGVLLADKALRAVQVQRGQLTEVIAIYMIL